MKKEKQFLYRFVVLNKEIVYDLNHKIEFYGNYTCDNQICVQNLSKLVNSKRFKRKKIEI
jgi:predicted RNA-binding protein YlxR (DUF448 family)